MLIGGAPPSGAGALVKILDLGTGRALFDDVADSPGFDLTRPGEMLGTSDYMSPEQAKDSHNIDIRTDVYALGCVLYHALAGEPPFADPSSVRQLLRHATEEPQPITQRNPEVPAALQQVLDWMLAKDPVKRYPAPARAAQALEKFVAGKREVAPRPDPCLDAYLEWVVTQDGCQNAAATAQPSAVPKQPPVSPRAKERPALEPEAPVGPASRSPEPSLRSPRKFGPEEEEDEPRRSRQTADSHEEEEEDEPARFLGMKPREVVILSLSLLGVIVLAVLAVAGFLVFRWLR